MTPQELFETGPSSDQFIHGSDVGVDESGGVWVKAGAKLRSCLVTSVAVQSLADRPASRNAREYTILTKDKLTMLDPRHRSEPIWDHVHELSTDSIGTDWIAVR